MKAIRTGVGIILIGFSLMISFGIIVSSLKEGDKDTFKYLVIPALMIGFGIFLLAAKTKDQQKFTRRSDHEEKATKP